MIEVDEANGQKETEYECGSYFIFRDRSWELYANGDDCHETKELREAAIAMVNGLDDAEGV